MKSYFVLLVLYRVWGITQSMTENIVLIFGFSFSKNTVGNVLRQIENMLQCEQMRKEWI